ncbi:MAG TPA: hypothetical protein VGH74_03490, partial [Planctomycetaceae bacterium]
MWFAQTASPAISQDVPPPPASVKAAIDLDELARKAEVIMALIGEHHIDPPTPAEMWLAGTRALQQAIAVAGQTPPLRLPPQPRARVRPLDTPELRRAYLNQLVGRDDLAKWQATSGQQPGDLLEVFVSGMTPLDDDIIFARDVMISARDVKRNESFRANRYIGIGIALRQQDGYPSIIPLRGGPME